MIGIFDWYFIQIWAGVTIGTATKSPCKNHIHFAIKRDGGYIEPTRFLEDRPKLFQPYKTECRDWKLAVLVMFLLSLCLLCCIPQKNIIPKVHTGDSFKSPPSFYLIGYHSVKRTYIHRNNFFLSAETSFFCQLRSSWFLIQQIYAFTLCQSL